jgi:hypothetical protein
VESMLQSLLGFVLGATTVILVEWLRKPSLKIRLIPTEQHPYPPGGPATMGTVVKAAVSNEMLPRWARWMSRSAAIQCRGNISFHHMDGQNIFGRSMPVKWLRTPEALPMQILSADGSNRVGFLVDPVRIMSESRDDIAPGESALLDVVVRFDADSDCYGWNLDAYKSTPRWRNPDWKLPAGRYLIRVEIFSGDQSCSEIFRLLNEGPLDAFRLAPTLRGDRVH